METTKKTSIYYRSLSLGFVSLVDLMSNADIIPLALPSWNLLLDNSLRPLDPLLRRTHTCMASFLILAQPWLQRLTDHTLSQKVDHLSNNNEDKGDGVHPVNVQSEDLDANRHTPEASCEKGDVEKCSGAETEQDRCKGVEEGKDECVSGEVASNLGVPSRTAEGGAVEDTRLRTVDEHAPESKLANNLIQRPFGNQPLFKYVGQTVESGA